jgi:hypothetical protein
MSKGVQLYLTAAEVQIVKDALVRHRIWCFNYEEYTSEEDWSENNKDVEVIDSIERKIY